MIRGKKKSTRKPKNPPKDSKRCTFQKSNGHRCRGARVTDTDLCAFHTEKLRAQGHAKTAEIQSERWREIKSLAGRVPLATKEMRALYENALIVEEDSGERRIEKICQLLDRLQKDTETSGGSGITGVITRQSVPARPTPNP